MGAVLSSNSSRNGAREHFQVLENEVRKRRRLSSNIFEDNARLIPSLPDEISIQILARIPRIYYLKMKLVSLAWKAAIVSGGLFNVRKELGTTEAWLYVLTKVECDKLLWHGFDPLSRRWQRLPTMPSNAFETESRKGSTKAGMWNVVSSSIKVADVIMGWLGRRDPVDQIPFGGCAIGAANGCLYVLGGISKASALRCVWQYDPVQNAWCEVSPMSVARAYCKAAVLNNKLYVVGGFSRGPGGLMPLQSAEVFDPHTGVWSRIPNMPFSKAQVLPTAFLAELLKPVATGVTSYRGKLFVAQSLCCWPFAVDVGGEVYDPELNSWVEMPSGMDECWPGKERGSKRLSATVGGELYALEPSSSLDTAKIRVYDHHDDTWNLVREEVPIYDFSDSESPCLVVGLLGKLYVISKDANNNVTVTEVDVQTNLPSFALPPSDSPDETVDDHIELAPTSETPCWRVVATRYAGSAELLSCQTLDL